MKKFWIILLIVIIVILVALFSTFFILNLDPSYDKSEMLTQEDVQEILNKRKDIDNIYFKFVDFEGKTSEVYIKGDMKKSVTINEDGTKKIVSGSITTEGKGMIIDEASKKISSLTMPASSLDRYDLELNIIDNENFNYFKFLGKTTVNDRNVIAVKLNKDQNFVKNILYIDEETGIIVKDISSLLKLKAEEYNVLDMKIGEVTDEDISITISPDYEVIQMD